MVDDMNPEDNETIVVVDRYGAKLDTLNDATQGARILRGEEAEKWLRDNSAAEGRMTTTDNADNDGDDKTTVKTQQATTKESVKPSDK